MLAIAFTGLIIWTESEPLSEATLHWVQFIGRFHPVILHLPIGLFMGLFALELVALRQRHAGFALATTLLAVMTALSAILAACLGLLLAANGDYSGDTLWWHKWLGIGFGAAVLFIVFLKMRTLRFEGQANVAYRVSLVSTLVLLTIVGHLGGNLTHGSSYLTDYAPEWLQELLLESVTDGTMESSVEFVGDDMYTQVVEPFFDQYCIQCHGPEKQKSGYRMDTYEFLMTPGKMGDTPITPFEVSQSMLIEYLLLPESEDMVMPPEGKPRPSADEIIAITHWVALGAQGPPVDPAIIQAQEAAASARLAELQLLAAKGIMIMPQSKNSNLFYVDLQNVSEPLNDDDWTRLATFKNEIIELNLANAAIQLESLEKLRGASQLARLNLSHLNAVDGVVDLLNSFTQLEHLNLFGADLSNQGLAELTVPASGDLYLGGTKVSADQFAAAASQRPSVKVYGDVDLGAVLEIEAIGKADTSEFYPKKK